MRIKQIIQLKIHERDFKRYSKKILKNYWKAHEKGIRFDDEYEDKISSLVDANIKYLLQKKEIKELKERIRKNWYKVFYVNYFMAFVMTDRGQILFRGRFFAGLVYALSLKIQMLEIFLNGYSIRENPYISTKGGIRCYFGVKSTMRKTGYTQEILLRKLTR